MPNQEQYRDLENGDPSLQTEPNHLDDGNSDEYTSLVRYISTYRDPGKEQVEEEETVLGGANVPWYAPWRRLRKTKKGAAFVPPDDWVNTDIKTGLVSSEADHRRSKVGFNEITTETENLFLKFLSYFTGPILYGTPSLTF
jgi:H+-transporting ATPase